MTNFGIQVAKTGKKVLSQNKLDEAIDNNFPLLKAFKQGSGAVNVSANGTYSFDVEHGLGYYPVYIYLIAPDPTNPSRRYLGNMGASGAHGNIDADSFIDKEKLRIAWTDNSGGDFKTFPYTVTFYYYIFYDKLQ